MLKKFDEAIPYFEKVDQILGSQGKLKMEERANLKDAYDLLITIYDQKGQKDKLKVYEEKFNNVDKVTLTQVTIKFERLPGTGSLFYLYPHQLPKIGWFIANVEGKQPES